MPIDYKKYPKNWKSEIRPAILERAKHKCEFCGVKNYAYVFRGKTPEGREVYQTYDGSIYDAANSEFIEQNYFSEISATGKETAIKVVLTIAHLDHDVANNDYGNLRALCQRCHNRYDIEFRKANRKKNENKNRGHWQ